jgi:hypothetical protein
VASETRADNPRSFIGIEYNTGHLFALDAFAHQVRALIGVRPIGESHKELSEDLVPSFNIANPFVLRGASTCILQASKLKMPNCRFNADAKSYDFGSFQPSACGAG